MSRLMLSIWRRLARFVIWFYHAVMLYFTHPDEDLEHDPLLARQTLTCAFCGYEHDDGVACDEDW